MTIEIRTDAQVTELRRTLTAAHFTHHKNAARYCNALANGTATQAEADAHYGSTMAATYAYVLAAVLREAVMDEDNGSLDLGIQLASLAEDLLTNGDLDGWNEDVMPDGATLDAHAIHVAAATAQPTP